MTASNRTLDDYQFGATMTASTDPNGATNERSEMEGLFILVFVVAVLVLLDVLASRFGVDSRSTNLDDWARSVAK